VHRLDADVAADRHAQVRLDIELHVAGGHLLVHRPLLVQDVRVGGVLDQVEVLVDHRVDAVGERAVEAIALVHRVEQELRRHHLLLDAVLELQEVLGNAARLLAIRVVHAELKAAERAVEELAGDVDAIRVQLVVDLGNLT
jgi:hypothetical protein